MSVILAVVLAAFIISTNSAYAAAGETNWGKISEVHVGHNKTYIFFDGCNCGSKVKLNQNLSDYNYILSTVLTAMSLNLEVQFYSLDIDERSCEVVRVKVRK
jgi:hypothetical protein